MRVCVLTSIHVLSYYRQSLVSSSLALICSIVVLTEKDLKFKEKETEKANSRPEKKRMEERKSAKERRSQRNIEFIRKRDSGNRLLGVREVLATRVLLFLHHDLCVWPFHALEQKDREATTAPHTSSSTGKEDQLLQNPRLSHTETEDQLILLSIRSCVRNRRFVSREMPHLTVRAILAA